MHFSEKKINLITLVTIIILLANHFIKFFNSLNRLQKELDKLRDKLKRVETIAEKTGPRMNVTKSEEQLTKLIKRNELKLKYVVV